MSSPSKRAAQALAVVAFLFLVSVSPAAYGDFIVVPNNLAGTVGNASDGNAGEEGLSIRAQQLFARSQFIVGGPLLIDQMAFRAAPGSGPAVFSAANLALSFSTSPRVFPAGLSPTFADNVGPDNTQVFSGPIALSSPGCAVNGTNPCAFDLVINFTTPFLYNPMNGTLLFDLLLTDIGAGSGALDVQVYTTLPIFLSSSVGSPGDAIADEVDPGGLVVQFRFTPVPEPSTWSMLFLVVGAFGLFARRRRIPATRN